MHWMIAICGKAVHDDIRGGDPRSHAVRRDVVSDDPLHDRVALFGVERSLVEADAGATAVLLLCVGSESLDNVGLSVTSRIAKRDDEATRMRRALIVRAAPGVDVNVAIGCDCDVSGVSNPVGEDARAKSCG